jgi:hypothetical protein
VRIEAPRNFCESGRYFTPGAMTPFVGRSEACVAEV